MPLQPIIRAVRAADVPALKDVLKGTELFPAEMLDPMIADYLAGASRDIWLTVEEGGTPVALAFCGPELMTVGTWNLFAIAVMPDRQGSGIGTAIVRHLEDRLAREGLRILLVETTGTPEFEATRRFYRRNGFAEEARIREFYDAGADKIVFWKKF